jgi:hypothetical protein
MASRLHSPLPNVWRSSHSAPLMAKSKMERVSGIERHLTIHLAL